MSEDEIMLLFSVYRDRFIAASKNDFVKYVSLFRNYGKEAGASLAHPHSQLITLPVVPDMASRRFGKDYTGMIKKEISSPRLILKTEKTVAIAPYASEFPYEVWILPLKPCKNIGSMQDEDRDNMAICARKILSKISRLLSDPAYNYCFVQSVNEDMHMYMRICPKLGTMAGFELNTGLTINSVPPEDAAKYLREI
jgi:UDPglucose--hexose-1-phosphate uridylyltransferase